MVFPSLAAGKEDGGGVDRGGVGERSEEVECRSRQCQPQSITSSCVSPPSLSLSRDLGHDRRQGSNRRRNCHMRNKHKHNSINENTNSNSESKSFSLTLSYKLLLLMILSLLLFPCVALERHHDNDNDENLDLDGPKHDSDDPLMSSSPAPSPLPSIQDHSQDQNTNTIPGRPPFLVVCTVDGTVHVLQASDGMPVSVFQSGVPLVIPSEPLSVLDRRIVPGLDGRLYVSEHHNDGILNPLEITVMDVLRNPVQTCRTTTTTPTTPATANDDNDDGDESIWTSTMDDAEIDHDDPFMATTTTTTTTECGIVTATKSVSLFALDALSGSLVWKQYPNGTTVQIHDNNNEDHNDHDDNNNHDPQSSTSTSTAVSRRTTAASATPTTTVLLQREDITVQQIDTTTGKSVWNVSLGTQQALDFGGGSNSGGASQQDYDSSEDDDDDHHHPGRAAITTTTTGSTNDARREHLMIDPYLAELPYVMFSEDGKRLTAVSASATDHNNNKNTKTTNNNKQLWGHDFPTVVASVFGLNGRSWRPLTVLEETEGEEVVEDDDDDEEKGQHGHGRHQQHQHMLPESPAGGITLHNSVYSSNPFRLFSMETLYDGIDWLIRMTSGRPYVVTNRIPKQSQMMIVSSFEEDNERRQRRQGSISSTRSQQRQRNNHLLPSSVRDDNNIVGDATTTYSSTFLALPSPHHHDDTTTDDPFHPNILWTQTGVFLTFPVIFGVAVCFIVGVVVGTRYVYKKKKEKWIQSQQQQQVRVSFRDNEPNDGGGGVRSESGSRRQSVEATTTSTTTNVTISNPKSFLRSHSLPGKMDQLSTSFDHKATTSKNETGLSTDLILASDVLPKPFSTAVKQKQPQAVDSDLVRGSIGPGSSPKTKTNMHHRAESTPPPSTPVARPVDVVRSTTTSTEASFSLIDGSIPLIQYARYASEFEELAALGKGGFGSVFQCRNALDGREYAIKKVHIRSDAKLSQAEFSRRLQRTLREVKSLALLDHPNIVRYYTAWLEQGQDGDHNPLDKSGGGSEYYMTTPTASAKVANAAAKRRLSIGNRSFDSSGEMSSSWPGRRGSFGGMGYFQQRRFSYGDSSKGDFQSDAEESYSESRRSIDGHRHDIQGVPLSLDDYGFVFDRSDENDSCDEESNNNGTAVEEEITIPLQDKTKEETFEDQRRRKDKESSNVARRAISFQSLSVSSDSDVSGTAAAAATGDTAESRNQSEGKRDEIHDKAKTQASAKGKDDSELASTHTLASRKYVLYIQMQFCSQKTIADFLSNEEARKGPTGNYSTSGVDIPYALSLFLQIVMGVKSVHCQGLIHRDLKPNNCFIDDAGVVKVGDFGLSRESSDANGGSQSGEDDENKATTIITKFNDNGDITAGVGTRSYASPEQMKGGSEYDSSTDIYSLGIILFEMCYPMYTGMERNIVLSDLRKHTFPDSWIDRTIPEFPTLHSLLLSMISNNPESRPSADEVVHGIESILEGFTVSSLDKKHHDGAILLRIETLREASLSHTMELVKDAARPDTIQILQYGLRGGENKQIMEFAVVADIRQDGSVCNKASLGHLLVSRLHEDETVLLVREVRPRSKSTDEGK